MNHEINELKHYRESLKKDNDNMNEKSDLVK